MLFKDGCELRFPQTTTPTICETYDNVTGPIQFKGNIGKILPKH